PCGCWPVVLVRRVRRLKPKGASLGPVVVAAAITSSTTGTLRCDLLAHRTKSLHVRARNKRPFRSLSLGPTSSWSRVCCRHFISVRWKQTFLHTPQARPYRMYFESLPSDPPVPSTRP